MRAPCYYAARYHGVSNTPAERQRLAATAMVSPSLSPSLSTLLPSRTLSPFRLFPMSLSPSHTRTLLFSLSISLLHAPSEYSCYIGHLHLGMSYAVAAAEDWEQCEAGSHNL